MNDYLYYVNGEFVPAGAAAVALNDLGFVRGYGVFDLFRTYGTVPFGLRAHLERLQRSASQIDLTLPWTLDEIEAIVRRTLAHNDATDVTVRIIATGGASLNFITPAQQPSLIVMLASVKEYPAPLYDRGASLMTVDLPRFMPTVKSLNYITAIRAQERARAAGAVEALYCGADGAITECTTSNFFVLRGDELITPDAGVLSGVTRAAVLDIASDLFTVVKRPIGYDELAAVDEAFITSTTKEIMPIVRVDDITVATGAPGLRTQYLRELFYQRIAHGHMEVDLDG